MYYVPRLHGDRLIGTLCTYCKNAVPNELVGCSWSRSLIPVDGWDAEQTILHRDSAYHKETFAVKCCPEFVLDCQPERMGQSDYRDAHLFHSDGTPVYKLVNGKVHFTNPAVL